MRPGLAPLAAAAVALLACTNDRLQERGDEPAAAPVPVAEFPASYDAGNVAGGPGKGRTYGVGRAASRAEIDRWNTDVGPDGAELPAGRGDVRTGAAIYAAKCAMCHGRAGEGIPPAFPTLVGRDSTAEGFRFASDPRLVKTIGNYWPNATTVFDYVRRAMPLTQPGSLTNDEVYALTAWLLAANKVIPEQAVLDARALRAVRMPYADRFVPDDRRGGTEVK
jgi:cytochrome c